MQFPLFALLLTNVKYRSAKPEKPHDFFGACPYCQSRYLGLLRGKRACPSAILYFLTMSTTSNFLEEAVHHHHPLSVRGLAERLFIFWFDSFVYNQIWEDPRVDAKALQLNEKSRMLTISSGGCNVLNYLIHKPEHIQAVDLNRNHLCVLKLKMAALQYLPTYEDFFLFFGNAKDERNQENYYTYMAEHLDDETREFWEGGSLLRKLTVGPRISYFEKNFYNFAKTGYYLRFLTFIAWTCRRDPKLVLTATTMEEQQQLFDENIAPFFDNWFVRSAGKFPFMLYSLGIPPQQFDEMQKENGSGLIQMYRERIKKMACDFPIDDNYFGWQAFAREYDPARRAIPDYLKEENFETLRTNLHRVSVKNITLTDYMRSQPDKSLDRFVFLDSQDWMKPNMIEEMWTEIARVARPGTRIIFRTAASPSPVEGALPPELKKKFTYLEEQSKAFLAEDRSAIYGGFHLYVFNE